MRTLIDHDPFLARQNHASWAERGCWPCHWIGCPDVIAPPFATAYRRQFALDQALSLRVHVTADERYDLFLDHERIGRGSERSDAEHWSYETYDLALDAGAHTLVARVWSLGPLAPYAADDGSSRILARPG